jgi:phenylpropionate dioxygenase-like ring-hydroxylating dioxygenase large terminal subunit
VIEQALWHPVALSADVADSPVAAQLLGQALVLWRDAQGAVYAWADKCPHRGAKLSLGRVVHGATQSVLECAYHGWQFGAGFGSDLGGVLGGVGLCTLVPALPDFAPPAGHCATVFEAREAYGMVWVRLQVDSVAEIPAFAAGLDAGLRQVHCGPYDVATSAPRVVENFLDMAHFGFVHEGYLGARDATALADYVVTETAQGPVATGCRAWQPRSHAQAASGADVSYSYAVVAPYCAVLTKIPDAQSKPRRESIASTTPHRESIALWVCPISPESSRVWFSLAVTDFSIAAQSLRDFQDTIFMQDKPILESQSPARLPLDPRAELHTAADKMSAAYRRYLRGLGLTYGVIS